ncbi:unnamed protein product (macronuclear) [Paramecium tetraurelia]|uniref:RRM domain-containing protein n=1 Tax=Paramecium tetraurelia TaxID=5888 RepID=A0EHI7_PARTE|nr:uncharacterized protein GSPATT00027102001 [Paramecium tetraurelia]CAK94778.1 unnamed protein product [Paramecium tetraurelia]|eukprot:XP_001462151.1 hypothetical protein (macronuclear) [Paramecium tetraurelia strain d4-2]
MQKKQVNDNEDRYKGEAGNFQSLESDDGPGPMKSVEGWILIAKGIHEEAQEDDLFDAFSKYGPIKNLHLNLDRRTGFVKGYALIEFSDFAHAQDALNGVNKSDGIYGKKVQVDWAFKKPCKKGALKPTKKQQ